MPSTTCGFCGRFSNMVLIHTGFVPPRAMDAQDHGGEELVGAFSCDYCRRVNVGRVFTESPSYDPDGNLLFTLDDADERDIDWTPTFVGQGEFADTPDHIAAAGTEAGRCLASGYLRAAVLLARAVVEAAAKHQKFTKGRLQDKIDAMYDARVVREHIRDGAHELRHFGNEMAHGDFVEPILQEDADLAITLMREILEEVFESPARVRRAKSARESRAR